MKSKPRLIGRYILCDPIAAGGMASVHLGRLLGGEGFSRTVAIKQLLPHFARDEEFVRMFLAEARILSRIHHPHVVAPLDMVRLDSELFIVMEYVHGESLASLVKAADSAVPARIACAVMSQALLGLHAGHEALDEQGQPLRIVHGDVSPQNILIGADGIARMVDFGIAKAASRHNTTQNRQLRGKLGYFAPEQLRLERRDRRTDVFTSGIVLWELLTGRRLFTGDTPAALAHEVLNGTIGPPSAVTGELPTELDAIVMKALSLAPDERFQTAQEMADRLSRVLPLASPLEVGGWVESLAGTELARRAESVSELESLSITELTLPGLTYPPEPQPAAIDGHTMVSATPFAAPPNAAAAEAPRVQEPQAAGAARLERRQASPAGGLETAVLPGRELPYPRPISSGVAAARSSPATPEDWATPPGVSGRLPQTDSSSSTNIALRTPARRLPWSAVLVAALATGALGVALTLQVVRKPEGKVSEPAQSGPAIGGRADLRPNDASAQPMTDRPEPAADHPSNSVGPAPSVVSPPATSAEPDQPAAPQAQIATGRNASPRSLGPKKRPTASPSKPRASQVELATTTSASAQSERARLMESIRQSKKP